uniref:Uncharacterized protein n=1 Tax=Junco hyemalis TaxID=40217 RepID=A0A8C5IKH6_JUNHY
HSSSHTKCELKNAQLLLTLPGAGALEGSSFLTKKIPAAQQKSMYPVGILNLSGPGFQYPLYNNDLAKFHQDILWNTGQCPADFPEQANLKGSSPWGLI